jgi:stage II sporulation protein GA (sporulation sigma-E factor processing peptidase)
VTVYLEYAIIDNLVINALLLYLTAKTIKQKPPGLRIFFAAVAGTFFALIMPLIQITGTGGAVAMVAIKLFVGAMMVFIVQNQSAARYILFFTLFITYTFALGGAVYGVLYSFTSARGSFLYFTGSASVPIGVFAAAAILFLWVLSKLVKFLNLRHSINNYLRDTVITYQDNKFKITSYLDTGNRLVDPISQSPVIIITMSLFLKMFPDISIDRIFLNKLCKEGIKDGHYISFSTVDKSDGKMFVFAPSLVEIIDKKNTVRHENVRLGVSMKGFNDAVKYDALLNARLA